MTPEEINKTLEHFNQYSDMDYVEFLTESKRARWFSHKEEDYFHIIIFEDGSVYQTGTEADTIGVELKTLEELKIRYRSFVGEEIDNY